VSAFFDKEGNATVISYVKDKYGMGRATGVPLFLKSPYPEEKLGQIIRAAMKNCENGAACPDNELMSHLNFKGWKQFSEGRKNISIHYQEGKGIVFNTTRRKADGAYHFNYMGEKRIENDVTDRELGKVTLELLQFCRC
jgi:hypothetical protein